MHKEVKSHVVIPYYFLQANHKVKVFKKEVPHTLRDSLVMHNKTRRINLREGINLGLGFSIFISLIQCLSLIPIPCNQTKYALGTSRSILGLHI